MTKQDYFKQLLDCLPEITPEEESQIYEYYDELICDGIEEGKTEEEMLLQFGDPCELASRIQKEWDLSALPIPMEALTPENGFTDDSGAHSGDNTVFCYTSVNHFEVLEFFISECRFSVTASADDAFHLYFPKKLQKFIRISEQNGKMYFQCRPKQKKVFSFFYFSNPELIRLEIPSGTARTLHATLRNTSVSVSDLNLDKIVLNTVNASIHLVSATTNDLNLVTTNGAVHLENVIYTNASLKSSNAPIQLLGTTGDYLHGETSNGKIHIASSTASFAEFTTSNSKISVESSFAGSISLLTSNGKIQLDHLRSKDISLQTNNGPICGNILGREEDYSVNCRTNAHHYCRPHTVKRPNAPGNLTAHTSNGDIRLEFLNE